MEERKEQLPRETKVHLFWPFLPKLLLYQMKLIKARTIIKTLNWGHRMPLSMPFKHLILLGTIVGRDGRASPSPTPSTFAPLTKTASRVPTKYTATRQKKTAQVRPTEAIDQTENNGHQFPTVPINGCKWEACSLANGTRICTMIRNRIGALRAYRQSTSTARGVSRRMSCAAWMCIKLAHWIHSQSGGSKGWEMKTITWRQMTPRRRLIRQWLTLRRIVMQRVRRIPTRAMWQSCPKTMSPLKSEKRR
mmetsp:Transcript_32610/g.68554  ORF Transcript_32610/g.68554 Transcript_32610/m.68554 type:complete len:249 (+) Transcript_32610:1426-2172(+)